jgi:RNA polymerase sigma-32 factor
MFRQPHLGRPLGVSNYVSGINTFPVLEKDEEYILTKQWKESGNSQAIDRIVKSHLRLVVKIAHGYRGYGLPTEDLIAEGTIGIMQAAQNFDPERGFRFSTYARLWIKASIQEYVMRSWSLVKMNTRKTHRKLFFGLNRLKTMLGLADGRNLSQEEVRQISEKMEVPEEHVIEVNQRLSGADFSLNSPLSEDNGVTWQDWVEDDSDNQETIVLGQQELRYRRDLLVRAIKHLTPREYEVLSLRRLSENSCSLEEVARQVGFSRERVRQIEKSAFMKLQTIVRQLSKSNPRALETCLIGAVLSEVWLAVKHS